MHRSSSATYLRQEPSLFSIQRRISEPPLIQRMDAFKAYCASVFTGSPRGGEHAEDKASPMDNVSVSCRNLAKMYSAFADQVGSLRETITGIGVGAVSCLRRNCLGGFFDGFGQAD